MCFFCHLVNTCISFLSKEPWFCNVFFYRLKLFWCRVAWNKRELSRLTWLSRRQAATTTWHVEISLEKQSIVSVENQSISRVKRDRAAVLINERASVCVWVASSEVAYLNQFSIIAPLAEKTKRVINYSFATKHTHTQLPYKTNKSRENNFFFAYLSLDRQLCSQFNRRTPLSFFFNLLVNQRCNKLQHKCIIIINSVVPFLTFLLSRICSSVRNFLLENHDASREMKIKALLHAVMQNVEWKIFSLSRSIMQSIHLAHFDTNTCVCMLITLFI